ncbi:LPXTG cell wall anchor domain-containing protein [Kitasatospora sp. NPDC085879]|uniref:LPXTG cell wall anchor domain-containing protein n=1 Tax=Kitasatospora sp. NPDC085879 TaxID=3154769 RepID=UPI00342172FB
MRTTAAQYRRRTALIAALAVSGLTLGAAPAFAETAAPGTATGTTPTAGASARTAAPVAGLTVQAPAAVGFAGQEVPFTETVTNPGTDEEKLTLGFTAEVGTGSPSDGLGMSYQEAAGGAWKPLPLTFAGGVFRGTLPGGVTVPAGGTRTVRLRIGAPMGTPHHGATNGGIESIRLRSALTASPDGGAPLAENTSTVAVVSPTGKLLDVPATAVAGGAPVEFDARLRNDTPSDYLNLAHVLRTTRSAKVEIRGADGRWTEATAVVDHDPDAPKAYYLLGPDASVPAGATVTVRVRLSFPAATPAGTVSVRTAILVNQWKDEPFATTIGADQARITVATAPATATPAPTGTATPIGDGTTGGTSGTSGTGELAATGPKGTAGTAAAGAALLALGAGILRATRRRRTA